MPWQLIVYCLIIALASWLGGWLPNLTRLSHRRTQLVLSLVSGVMLGVALLHLLPHSIGILGDIDIAMATALAGLLFMFFMVRLFHFHQHDVESDHEHPDSHAHAPIKHRHGDISWVGIAFGFSVHTIIDGIALAAAVQSEASPHAPLAGIGVFLAVLLHKPLDALAITSVMAARGWTAARRNAVNLGFSLMCPMGALLFAGAIDYLPADQTLVLGFALAFSAGVFLCISLGDLLPEVQFHSHDRLGLSAMLLLGVAVAFGIEMLPGHEHDSAHDSDIPAEVTDNDGH